MTTRQRSLIQEIWDFFCSLKLTMFLLISLAITSIIGTVIPQGSVPPEYLQTISQTKMKLYQALGFFDMYHSWWFILLLTLLTANLIACSIKRLPNIWKTITQPVTVLGDSLENTLPNITTLKTEWYATQIKDKLIPILRVEFAEPMLTECNGCFHLFAQKASWCRLSVYAVHLSVIIIFLGTIIGSLFGYKGFVTIVEGESVAKVMSRSGKEIDLGFAVRCDKFSVAFYDTGAPKEFKSILTVLENGKPAPGNDHLPIIVNSPLTYKGVTFYQSSYGKVGEQHFTVSDINGKNPVDLVIGSDSSTKLPDGSGMHVLETTPDISHFEKGLSGPAANIEVHTPQGTTRRIIVFANHPELNMKAAQRNGGPLFTYKGGEEKMYTGLQVAKDPGVWVVWFGCFLMVTGIYAAFFISHRRLWVRIQDGNVTIGGNASKNPSGYQLFLDLLVEKFKTELSAKETT